ncbi:MAG: hypothetical protein HN534_00285 [Euryarchaeota archaeon]|jgi:hypothetical protein|nr:hypothetical protein [Euryarchaeota archaeon]MBT3653359.1 hypothetical protein [Euryarchaeota archaeon]MBT3758227.1 hypothetical protein [Euryarchaeota archaeon]MBT4051336.1 hypothetical protein [Euryarchaeota archaeon]MBT4346626.1 hypothetical protein [Euryarchaeota archaeon]|tara:strand:- start:1888 stop:2259 length:372 start_codon:yes stop_codon:yes gene_type:complete
MDWVKNPALLPLWEVLKKIAKELEGPLDLMREDLGYYKLVKYYTKSQFESFLAICIQKTHVSIYLNPLYRNPHLVFSMPESLLKHKTGKCTLRFFSEDDPAIEHLPKLLQDCLHTWVDEGIIS